MIEVGGYIFKRTKKIWYEMMRNVFIVIIIIMFGP